jgi:energy-converting hydrogenase Eha subunit C
MGTPLWQERCREQIADLKHGLTIRVRLTDGLNACEVYDDAAVLLALHEQMRTVMIVMAELVRIFCCC